MRQILPQVLPGQILPRMAHSALCRKSRPIYPRRQCRWQKCSDAALAEPFWPIWTARRALFPAKSTLSGPGGPSGATGQYITEQCRSPFSTQPIGVSYPVRDHGGLTRVPLPTDPSVLPRSVHSDRMDGHHAYARETGSVVGQMHPDWYVSRGQESDRHGKRAASLAPGANVRGKSAAMRPSRSPFG
jgi:hypothetical protein